MCVCVCVCERVCVYVCVCVCVCVCVLIRRETPLPPPQLPDALRCEGGDAALACSGVTCCRSINSRMDPTLRRSPGGLLILPSCVLDPPPAPRDGAEDAVGSGAVADADAPHLGGILDEVVADSGGRGCDAGADESLLLLVVVVVVVVMVRMGVVSNENDPNPAAVGGAAVIVGGVDAVLVEDATPALPAGPDGAMLPTLILAGAEPPL